MYTERIVNRQIFYFFFMMRTTFVLSFLPVLTAADAMQDAWLAAVIAFFGGSAVVYAIARLAVAFPDKSIIHYSQELLGGVLGRLVSFAYLGLFLFIAGTELRIYGEVLKGSFMIETPLVVLLGTMVLLAAMVVYAGLEPLARTADVIFPIFILMIIASFFFPLWHADWRNLQPVLHAGWPPVLFAAITPIAIAAQYVNLTMLVPSVEEPKKALNAALLSMAAASLVLVLFAALVVAVLGADGGSQATFPVFKMIRSIRISDFLERVESLTILAWGIGLFTSLSLNLYAGSKGLAELLGIRDNRPLILPMAVIWVVFALQGYQSIFEMKQFLLPVNFAPFVLITLLLPLALLWAAYFIKKIARKRQTEEG